MLQRVFVAAWSARSRRTAVHPAAVFPLTAGDMQGLPERVLAPQRRLDSIGTRMTAHHLFAYAVPEPALAPVRG
jgi:hypothetical protein